MEIKLTGERSGMDVEIKLMGVPCNRFLLQVEEGTTLLDIKEFIKALVALSDEAVTTHEA